MKTIEVDDELYSYIASHTGAYRRERIRHFLRRMLKFSATTQPTASGEGDACGATRCRSETVNPVKDSSRDA